MTRDDDTDLFGIEARYRQIEAQRLTGDDYVACLDDRDDSAPENMEPAFNLIAAMFGECTVAELDAESVLYNIVNAFNRPLTQLSRTHTDACSTLRDLLDHGDTSEIGTARLEQAQGRAHLLDQRIEHLEAIRDINNGVTKGLAALTASQLLAFDSTCNNLDPASCGVYPGTPRACQRGIGGIFDACELPAPAGPGPYLDLVFSIGALDSNLTLLAPTSPLRGAWEKLRDPAVSAIETLETPFVTASNTVSASTTPNANDAIAEKDLQIVRQELLNGTADNVFDAFGPGAINGLFVGQGPDGAAAGNNGRISDVTRRESPVGDTALSLVANAYGVSASETVPAQPAPLVDEDDVAAAAHDDARNCVVVGSQCTDDSFGACISRDRVLCCFNSPLARLAQESAIPQFGRDFGSAELPNCRGLTGSEIQTFDWAALDLDQWIAILGTADRFPSPEKLTPDGLTGTGNFLDLANPDEPRPDVVSRTRQRLEGIDPATVRRRDEFRAGRQSKGQEQ